MGTALALAIPAYNEADGIAGFLDELDRWFEDWDGPVTMVVADDHSTDGTADLVEQLAPGLSAAVLVVRSERNGGHGATVMRAYREAVATRGDVVLQIDGDGQFDGRDVRRVAEDLCRSGADAVIARRRTRTDPWFRKVLTRGLRTFLRARAGLRAGDPNCPLRAYRRPVLEALLTHVPRGASVPNVHLAALADAAGVTTTEIVVEHRVRRGGSAQGTMWGPRRRTILVPRRLVVFAWGALAECRAFLRHLDHAAVRASVDAAGAGTAGGVRAARAASS